MAERSRGFTLIEILVAMVILALVLGATHRLFAQSARQVAAVEDIAIATLLAQSQLETVGVTLPLQPGVTEGRFDDRFFWRIAVTELPESPAGARIAAYGVSLRVSWDSGRGVELETVRLGPVEP
jgi:general secretion pathway protein I